jgi:hypothetical protein
MKGDTMQTDAIRAASTADWDEAVEIMTTAAKRALALQPEPRYRVETPDGVFDLEADAYGVLPRDWRDEENLPYRTDELIMRYPDLARQFREATEDWARYATLMGVADQNPEALAAAAELLERVAEENRQ